MQMETSTPVQVRKRDGLTLQPFDANKIQKAVRGAWGDTGLAMNEAQLQKVVASATSLLSDTVADVEQIQDTVEVALMKNKLYAVAKAYILFRNKRAELRQERKKPDPLAVSNYIHFSKYARHREEWQRREVYAETVARVEEMHLRKFATVPGMPQAIKDAFKFVYRKEVLPSMRSMQFGGAAIEQNNNRIYNCTFSYIDRPRVFGEALYLLLCGSGVGYSVQYDHVDKLPPLKYIDEDNVVHHTIADTIEGWADALTALVNSYIRGYNVEFNYSMIRLKGTPLKTSGGKAPGHRRLKQSLKMIRQVLSGAQGRKLRPIECHDIMCHAADAVLSGGIRRSAMISLFSLEDSEMMYAKTGVWYKTAPWRANANNSVAVKRDEVKKKQFKRIFQMTKEWGEPGLVFVDDAHIGTNPCAEISLNARLVIDADTVALLTERAELRNKPLPNVKMGEVYSGWAFCNLCEINAAKFTSPENFYATAQAAAVIGTCQAAHTDMPYLGWVSEVIAEREALLGVGMTGMLDAPAIACNPEYQRNAAKIVTATNAIYAKLLGIRTAARATCVKPSGTTSLELGCVASGHHAHHAKRYIRRVIADELEPAFQKFKSVNPHMCVKKPDGKWVIEFPVEAPEGATVKDDLTALEFLAMVRSTQENWVIPGTARPDSTPGATHNVSNTVTVKPDEWDAVAEYIWTHRETFSGVSLLPSTGDKDYSFAPNEAVTTPSDEIRYNQLVHDYTPVDYTEIVESADGTDLVGEAACAGGACAI